MERVLANQVKERAPLFVNHWTAVNADRVANGKTALALKSGVVLAEFADKIGVLTEKVAESDAKDQNRVVLAAQRDGLRTQTRDGMEAWRKAALYQLDGDSLLADLPTLPQQKAADADLLKIYGRVSARWEAINVARGDDPLLTRDGLTRAAFDTQVSTLSDKVAAIGTLDDTLPILHDQRDDAAREVKDIFAEYRRAILADYPAVSPFVLNLPTVNPRATGTTPEAVALSVTVDAANHTAHATWTASTGGDLERYSFRISAGPKYKSNDEVSIGDLTPNVHEFTVGAQYLPTGSTVWGKVYVVTTEGHEKGSDAKKLTP